MIITAHLLTGVAIGSASGEILPALFLGYFSHFFLDMLPHWDITLHTKSDLSGKLTSRDWLAIIIDGTISLILFIIIINKTDNFWPIFAGAIGANLPDIFDNLPLWNKFFRHTPPFSYLWQFHDDLHYQLKSEDWYWGLPLPIIIMGGLLWYLLG